MKNKSLEVILIIIGIVLFLHHKKFQKHIVYPIKNICEKSQFTHISFDHRGKARL